MPETAIGLFPDVGGGYFLSRCPGCVGEWLALTGDTIGAGDAVAFNLADGCLPSEQLPGLWETLASTDFANVEALNAVVRSRFVSMEPKSAEHRSRLMPVFLNPASQPLFRPCKQAVTGRRPRQPAAQALTADAACGAGADSPRPQDDVG
ncbi:enoyl-CoA hydratase/isomerase family protein [Staphylococcus epidermidis]|nr:enoyl-CoA hydratase/isomerase family protein [Staphylococcus epidermidis]